MPYTFSLPWHPVDQPAEQGLGLSRMLSACSMVLLVALDWLHKLLLVSTGWLCKLWLTVLMFAANHVFLLEPSMDPAILQQAVGRAHRMGQTRTVHVTRLIMHSTVEVTPHHCLQPCMHATPLLMLA